ncbi:hypothetical protein [Solirubrobacter deserti]|uniref:Uncharacterized protein n=1 Tax=Solirubrobacter deserti TaxID=2282478 RepID=A0ABT4RDM0_9ACTN|nr:hypothetical protein [Solirubrobacter deserti]MDA0136621.1 hypothetical protein [Solirubrobacter deserti]
MSLVVGLALAFLFAPAAAQASDASFKSTVKREAKRLSKAEDRYEKNVADDLETEAQLQDAKTETEKLIPAVQRFHDKIDAETPESQQMKTAQKKLVDASETYINGLNKLADAIGDKSKSKIKSAAKTLASAVKKFRSAAKTLS